MNTLKTNTPKSCTTWNSVQSKNGFLQELEPSSKVE